MARTIATALAMPLTERRMRYEAMMEKLRGHSIQQWFSDFIEALRESQTDRAERPPAAETPTLWSLRSAGSSASRLH
jgi:trehalose 6-phosphate synthase